ncbi:hypothetical protein M8C21_021353 [Ambrosia artemisiifolia]|uniref:DUF1990 domain-containing protein n=1 Tax=Ambrosia artemisiifolia TaxID=4212 RepID=A0AAD5BQ65_AMBAR|nr:hypothetical protein M8C21_021353 [Ambrosia artemisiifolia]
MVFLSWTRPSPKEQKDCINKSGTFNYDVKYRGATAKPLSTLKEDKELSSDGFVINHSKIMVGTGSDAYEKGKTALKTWRMPLQVVYVNETKSRKANIASFGFGAGTLSGHLLSGEERFAIEMDGDKQVWYEILSFSKPAHALSVIGYPYVLLRQKYFAHQSSEAVKKFVSSN